jgi:hypothetical protein
LPCLGLLAFRSRPRQVCSQHEGRARDTVFK